MPLVRSLRRTGAGASVWPVTGQYTIPTVCRTTGGTTWPQEQE